MKKTALTEIHRSLGAKMVDYAGYEMPVQYTSVLDEHLAVRSQVGLFDLSHMGEFELTGSSALETVNRVTTNDASQLEIGDIQYTFLTTPQGGIIDDILVYRTELGFLLVVNAANATKDYAWINQNLLPGTKLHDQTPELTLIAVQGPKSAPLVEEILGLSVQNLRSYTFSNFEYRGSDILLSRTGYTGEDGFELYFSNQLAGQLWTDLTLKGEKYGVVPVGLGARDTLRLEMRMPLYGNDIDELTNPYEAGLGRFVKLAKGDFIGRNALERVKVAGAARKLVAFTMIDKGIPRQGYPLLDAAGKELGIVTSGTHSPSLNKAIGMGYVEIAQSEPGTIIQVQIRKKTAQAQLIKGRFLT